jgi:hypothetical protein
MSAANSCPDRVRVLIGREANGLPRTYRVVPARRQAAYRRLAGAILGLDVETLSRELRQARRTLVHAAQISHVAHRTRVARAA